MKVLYKICLISKVEGVKRYSDPPYSKDGGVLTPWTPPSDALASSKKYCYS